MSSPRMRFVGVGALQVLIGLGLGLVLGVGQARAGSSLEACLAGCKRSGLSETNRATCRLDCETDAASDPDLIRAKIAPLPGPKRPPAATTRPGRGEATPASVRGPACKTACDDDRALSEDDRATCKLECDLEPAPMPTGTPPPMRPAKASPAASTPTPVGPRVASTPPSAVAVNQAEFLGRCHATCTPGATAREATDHDSCKLDCDTMASVLDVADALVPDAWRVSPRIATRVEMVTAPAAPAPASKPVRARMSAPAAAGGDTCGPDLQTCRASCVKTETRCARACGRKHLSETDRETCKLGCGTDQEVCQGDCLTATATCVNSRHAPRGG